MPQITHLHGVLRPALGRGGLLGGSNRGILLYSDPSSWDPSSWDPISWDPISWDPSSWDPISWDPISWDPISWDPFSWDPISWRRGSHALAPTLPPDPTPPRIPTEQGYHAYFTKKEFHFARLVGSLWTSFAERASRELAHTFKLAYLQTSMPPKSACLMHV